MSENNIRFFNEFDYPNYEDWKSAAVTALKGVPFDKVMYTGTYEGIELKPIYNKVDLEGINFLNQEYPGFYPFNRGINNSGYKGKNWEIRQNIPYFDSNEFNKALKNDLASGQNSIKINFEKATAIHEDFISDDIYGYELLVAKSDDLKSALEGIDLTKFPINIDAGIAGFTAFAALCDVAKSQIDIKNLKGSLVFDFVSELSKEGIIYDNLSRFINEIYAITSWSKENCPQFRTIGIKPSDWHNAGANAVQESAIALSLGVYYIKELLNKGLDIDVIAPRMSFNFSIGTNFFMEIAKFRALRIIWSKIIKEFGGNEESRKMYISAVTSEREMTRVDPYVNLLRSTSQVFSAVAGNCDSITVNNFDMEFGLPSDFSRRIARNTQNVIKYESHLDDTIDPAAGSYYIESLTNELVNSIWKEFLEIENKNGILEVIKSGEIQNNIEQNFNNRQTNLALRKDIIVGVNKYANTLEKPIETTDVPDRLKIDLFVSEFEEFLNKRDLDKIDSLLDEFENIFESNPVKAMDLAIEALNNGAGLGELYNSVPTPECEIIEVEPIILRRSSEVFEIFRDLANDFIIDNGKNPNLEFVCFGSLRDWKARADFANDFFAVGGFTNTIIDGIQNSDEALAKLDFSNKKYIVVCSTDDIYTQVIPDFAKKVKEINKENYIILAGYPKDKIEEFKSAGVDMFIHVKANIVECLTELYNIYGLIN
jgi:methylmalonyl-CoA mutase